jgi:hypothetical protein
MGSRRLERVAVATVVCAAVFLAAVAGSGLAIGRTSDPGKLPQTRALPSTSTRGFRAQMTALWNGIVADSLQPAMPAFFPRSAYLKVKQISDPAADYRDRLLGAFGADIRAAHALLGREARRATFLYVSVPRQWAWINPGHCFNRIGYWHAPGSRLVYRQRGQLRSFGIYSLISWRGEWYVVHLAEFDRPGTVYEPALGRGRYGPPGGC